MEEKIKNEESISISESVTARVEGNSLILKKGSLESSLSFRGFDAKVNHSSIHLSSKRSTRKEKRFMNTFKAHLLNTLKGFDAKYVYKLQICAVHFPMTVTFDKPRREIIIKNFLGERVPRTAKILPGVDVKIEKDLIVLESHDKYGAGQSAGNIEIATRITKRDRRVFQDGIWIISKFGEEI